MSTRLSGLYIDVTFDPTEKSLVVLDLVDTNNEPAMMSRSKKGIEKCWEQIRSEFSSSWTWANITAIIESHGIKMHHWCRMD